MVYDDFFVVDEIFFIGNYNKVILVKWIEDWDL